MKKLTTKEKLGACGVLYAGILILLGQMKRKDVEEEQAKKAKKED